MSLASARGALWGQAVGDALGTTVEFERPEAIAAAFPNGVRALQGGGPFEVLPGQVTDDTELALCLARSLATKRRYDDEDVAERYLSWCRSGPIDCGGTTRRAFGGEAAVGQVAAVVRARALRDSQANGALMRVSPLGVFHRGEAVLEPAAADAALSHPHPVCVAANQVYAFALSSAVHGTGSPSDIFDATLALCRSNESCLEVLPTLELAQHELPRDAFRHMGWVRHALQAAFHQLLHARSFEEGVVEVIALGGDTDTNACIAGALLGAVHGVEAIPVAWREAVRRCEPRRPKVYWCHDLDGLADALLAG